MRVKNPKNEKQKIKFNGYCLFQQYQVIIDNKIITNVNKKLTSIKTSNVLFNEK